MFYVMRFGDSRAFISYRVTFGPSVCLFTISNIGLPIPFTAEHAEIAEIRSEAHGDRREKLKSISASFAVSAVNIQRNKGLYPHRLPNKN